MTDVSTVPEAAPPATHTESSGAQRRTRLSTMLDDCLNALARREREPAQETEQAPRDLRLLEIAVRCAMRLDQMMAPARPELVKDLDGETAKKDDELRAELERRVARALKRSRVEKVLPGTE